MRRYYPRGDGIPVRELSQEEIVEEVLKVIPDARAIILYGSRVTGKHRPDSDFDVRAVVPSRKAALAYDEWEYQATIDCNMLDKGIPLHETPRIDLYVDYRIESDSPHTTLWTRKAPNKPQEAT